MILSFINILLGVSLFVLGLRKIPTTMEKFIGRMKTTSDFQMQGVFFPYFLGIVGAVALQGSTIAVIMMMFYMLYARVRFHSAYAFMLGVTLGTSLKFWMPLPDTKVIAASILVLSQLAFLFMKGFRFRAHFTLLGWLGLLFLGWSLLKDGTTSIISVESSDFIKYLSQEASTIEIFGLGTLLSGLFQSSSLIINLASQAVEQTNTELYNIGLVVLGANVGTTITAILVSLWLPIKAKRLAVAHFGVKLLGALLCFTTYQTFLSTVDNLFISLLKMTDAEKVYAIHTGFNIFNSVAFLFLVPAIDKIMSGIVKDKKGVHIDENTFLSKSLIQLLSNVPEEGLAEARKQFKYLSFSIKAYEDRLIKSFSETGIREGLDNYSINLVTNMRALEELLLIIRHKHPFYSDQAHEILIDFYRLRKILSRVDDINDFIRDFSREDLNESVKLLGEFIDEWQEYRSKVWKSIFKAEEGERFAPKSQVMSTYFLKNHDRTQNIRPQIMTSSYRMGLFMITLAESWELLWRHQMFEHHSK
jgi:Na+/phosphate symporter